MKKIVLFALIFRFLPISKNTDCFKNIELSPIDKDEQLTLSYDFEVSLKSEVSFYFYIESEGNNTFVYSRTKVINNKISDSIDIENYKIKQDSTLVMTAKCDRFYSEVSFLITFANNEYKNEREIYNEYAIQFLDDYGRVHSCSELLSFNYEDYYQNNKSYICFDVMKIKQETYYSFASLEDSIAELSFLDEDNVFPLLSDKDNIVNLKLRLIKTKQMENEYIFELIDKLYLDKKTYLISNVPKEGFEITDKLYIPKKIEKNIYDFEFKFSDFGLQNIGLVIEMKYEINPFIGNSDDSKYYFSITESNEKFTQNKVEVEI